MSISAISETTATTSSSISSSTSLGQEDFLELLIAQLENQDPLEPQSNTEFIAQLATFSSLEQQTITNDKLDSVISSTSEMGQATALGMLNESVVAQSDEFAYQGQNIGLGFLLTEPATSATMSILDEDNSVVRTYSFDALDAGEHFVTWDGTDDAGNLLPSGDYSLAVNAADGQSLLGDDDVAALVQSSVSAVEMGTSGSVLVTAAGDFSLSEIYSVGGN